ncbi:MAG: hypothetical protein M1826_007729 [Phylliscum demangeonii]|nr:MAG: hypothetical protein M1826_007729 [Phylliscum demangeonii]
MPSTRPSLFENPKPRLNSSTAAESSRRATSLPRFGDKTSRSASPPKKRGLLTTLRKHDKDGKPTAKPPPRQPASPRPAVPERAGKEKEKESSSISSSSRPDAAKAATQAWDSRSRAMGDQLTLTARTGGGRTLAAAHSFRAPAHLLVATPELPRRVSYEKRARSPPRLRTDHAAAGALSSSSARPLTTASDPIPARDPILRLPPPPPPPPRLPPPPPPPPSTALNGRSWREDGGRDGMGMAVHSRDPSKQLSAGLAASRSYEKIPGPAERPAVPAHTRLAAHTLLNAERPDLYKTRSATSAVAASAPEAPPLRKIITGTEAEPTPRRGFRVPSWSDSSEEPPAKRVPRRPLPDRGAVRKPRVDPPSPKASVLDPPGLPLRGGPTEPGRLGTGQEAAEQAVNAAMSSAPPVAGGSMTRPTPTLDSSNRADSGAWQARVDSVLQHLPAGIDAEAAAQIVHEIVVHGDEVHWDDVAGLDGAKEALKEAVVYPFLRPDLFQGLREPARGMLLFGPPGTGKTMLARTVATESRSTFFSISASSLTSKYLGESEKLVRALFALAKSLAPSIIFVDEIDALLSARASHGEHEASRRIKSEFLIQWSDLARAAAGAPAPAPAGTGTGKPPTTTTTTVGDPSRVLVLAATNLPWDIDEAARRRFVRRQYIPLPEGAVRAQQLRSLLGHQKHSLTDANLRHLVELTDGFSGSDITALAKDAAMGPLRSLGEALLQMSTDQIRPMELRDFEASLVTIRPSVGRAGLRHYEEWAAEFGERGG